VSIDALEHQVRTHEADDFELLAIFAELGHRRTNRAADLKALVARLLENKVPKSPATPLFDQQ
jgi:hypothetical protein